jgi:uncharacterized protein
MSPRYDRSRLPLGLAASPLRQVVLYSNIADPQARGSLGALATAIRSTAAQSRILVMKPRLSVVTLGVIDLEQSLVFYRDGLGLPTEGIIGREFEHGAVAFFELSGGLKLAIWAQDDIAHDTGLARTPLSPTSFTLGHNVAHREEVDRVIDQAREAGAEIIKAPQETFYGGYAAYFRDPNGHVWEVVWNPAFLPTEVG